jgi:hypothetical protein
VKFQIPSTKSQTNPKFKAPRLKNSNAQTKMATENDFVSHWNLELVWVLRFGYWSFVRDTALLVAAPPRQA